MTPFILLGGLVVALAIGWFLVRPYLRREAIDAQQNYVCAWEDTVERNPIPQYKQRLEEERAKLARMKAKQPAAR